MLFEVTNDLFKFLGESVSFDPHFKDFLPLKFEELFIISKFQLELPCDFEKLKFAKGLSNASIYKAWYANLAENFLGLSFCVVWCEGGDSACIGGFRITAVRRGHFC